MNRGEIWTIRDDGYASKARPVIIVQTDPGEYFNSVILCLFTTFESSHIPTRIRVMPNETNGLRKDSFVMTEKLIAINKKELGEKIGVLTDEQMRQISRQLAKLLDIHKEDIEE
jgi:mRNA interferase MazF